MSWRGSLTTEARPAMVDELHLLERAARACGGTEEAFWKKQIQAGHSRLGELSSECGAGRVAVFVPYRSTAAATFEMLWRSLALRGATWRSKIIRDDAGYEWLRVLEPRMLPKPGLYLEVLEVGGPLAGSVLDVRSEESAHGGVLAAALAYPWLVTGRGQTLFLGGYEAFFSVFEDWVLVPVLEWNEKEDTLDLSTYLRGWPLRRDPDRRGVLPIVVRRERVSPE
jgi:hypothetical protein